MHTCSILALLLLLPAAAFKYRGESKLKVVDQTQPHQIAAVLDAAQTQRHGQLCLPPRIYCLQRKRGRAALHRVD